MSALSHGHSWFLHSVGHLYLWNMDAQPRRILSSDPSHIPTSGGYHCQTKDPNHALSLSRCFVNIIPCDDWQMLTEYCATLIVSLVTTQLWSLPPETAPHKHEVCRKAMVSLILLRKTEGTKGVSGIGNLVVLCACFPGCSHEGNQVGYEDILLRASLIKQVVFHGRWRSV